MSMRDSAPRTCGLIAEIAVAILAFSSSLIGSGIVTNCTEENLRATLAGGGTVTFACAGSITISNTLSIEIDTILDGAGHQV